MEKNFWLAKDESGVIFVFYNNKPRKDKDMGVWFNDGTQCFVLPESFPISSDIEPEWGDNEPVEVVMSRTLK